MWCTIKGPNDWGEERTPRELEYRRRRDQQKDYQPSGGWPVWDHRFFMAGIRVI